MPCNSACLRASFSSPTSSACLPEMKTISAFVASSGEIYFSFSACRRVRGSSHVCLGRRNEAAVGDLLVPIGKHQSLDLKISANVREARPTFEVAGAIMCPIMFSTGGIIPLDSKPFALLFGHGTDIANSTCLPF